MKYVIVPFLLFSCFNVSAADTLTIDPTHSVVAFNWSHFGFANQAARFEKLEGKIILDQENIGKSSVSVRIPVAGLRTAVDLLDRRLQKDEFFAAAKYPDITFVSREVVKGPKDTLMITGDLSMHGVTRSVVLDGKINKIQAASADEPARAGFEATTRLRRTDYGVDKYVPAVSDHVFVHISLEVFQEG